MKNNKTPKSLIISTIIGLIFFTSCKNEKLSNSLNFNCSEVPLLKNLKNVSEPNGNFQIKIPSNWKKEFFISDKESRLYFADTTKELNQAYIADIGLFQIKKKIDKKFLQEKLDEIKGKNHLELKSSKKILFKEKPGYIFHITQNLQNIEKNTFEIYLQNKNRSYYLIKVDVYGTENQTTRFCEALALLEKGNYY